MFETIPSIDLDTNLATRNKDERTGISRVTSNANGFELESVAHGDKQRNTTRNSTSILVDRTQRTLAQRTPRPVY